MSYIIIVYLLGIPFTAGLMGGLGTFCEFSNSQGNWWADLGLTFIWPLFWAMWLAYKLGETFAYLDDPN